MFFKSKSSNALKYSCCNIRLKQGDKVIVISGNDKGVVSEIKSVRRLTNRIQVKDVALQKKHVKQKSRDEKGMIIQIERYIHISNVQYYCSACKKGVRIGVTRDNDSKKRFCKNCKKLF